MAVLVLPFAGHNMQCHVLCQVDLHYRLTLLPFSKNLAGVVVLVRCTPKPFDQRIATRCTHRTRGWNESQVI
jgi:hypothetical protein